MKGVFSLIRQNIRSDFVFKISQAVMPFRIRVSHCSWTSRLFPVAQRHEVTEMSLPPHRHSWVCLWARGIATVIHAESFYVEETETLVGAGLIFPGQKDPHSHPTDSTVSQVWKKIKAFKNTQLISQVFKCLLSSVKLFILPEMFQMHPWGLEIVCIL